MSRRLAPVIFASGLMCWRMARSAVLFSKGMRIFLYMVDAFPDQEQGTGQPRNLKTGAWTEPGTQGEVKISQRLSTMMMATVVQPRILSQVALANSPILVLLLVKRMSGQMAKPSCMLSTTWLPTSKAVVLLSP